MALTQETSRFDYRLLPWGDMVQGSKAELQALGIGLGMAFPGEPGGNKRLMHCKDPRGFRCRVFQDRSGVDFYYCQIPFPDRKSQPEEPPTVEVAPGVTRRSWATWFDEYIGSADALVAAGIVRAGHFPGLEGMRKTCVRILPSGEPVSGPATANPPEAAHAPGAMEISRAGRHAFRVRVHVTDEIQEARFIEWKRKDAEHNAMLMAMPRPRPLVAPSREAAAREQRQQLRLVWSRPAPTFSLR